jgi:hypothetical protein
VEEQKGKDRGIDGRLYFRDDPKVKAPKQIILSVKAGKTGPPHVRDLRGVVEREQAQGAVMGALLTLQDPTPEMVKEAATAGFYHSPWGTKHPKLQLLTAEQLLGGRGLSYPAPGQTNVTLRKTERAQPKGEQQALPGITKTKEPGQEKTGRRRSSS